MSRSRAYTFTINNPTEDDEHAVRSLGDESRYIIVGREYGEEKETEHLQGYVFFKNARSFNSIKRLLLRAHIEKALATPSQNRAYCSKQSIWLEQGELPVKGKRTDIEESKEIIEDNKHMPLRACIEQNYNNQVIRMVEKRLTYFEEERNWEMTVYWFHGKTGSGKSREAFRLAQELGNYYVCNETDRWWDGYDAHEVVIIDDMRSNFCTYNRMLNILDRYACRVEVKGGYRQLRAKTIIITSPFPPQDLWPTKEDKKQLLRRITEIREIKKQK